MTSFSDATQQIEGATCFADLCEPPPDGVSKDEYYKKVYRRFARVVHPDNHQTDEKPHAQDAFGKLTKLYEFANSPEVFLESRTASHRVIRPRGNGTICLLYATQTSRTDHADERATFLKVARSPHDNDLLQTEARALEQLRAPGTDEQLHPFFPELIDTFVYQDTGRTSKQATVVERLDGFYELTQIKKVLATLSPIERHRHVTWIWRKILWALRYAHQQGIIHGAIVPEHIMVLPEQHGIVLVDWCYASIQRNDSSFPPLVAIADTYCEWYPLEVFAKQAPTPNIDLTMAARCMIDLLGGDPSSGIFPDHAQVLNPFRAHFRGCLNSTNSTAGQLLSDFDELRKRLGPPFSPRKFLPLIMPNGMV